MAEQGQDVIGWAGDDIDIYIYVLGYDGLPLDLTDCTLTWGLGAANSSPATLLKSSTVSTEIQILDAITGQVVVHLDPPDTEVLSGTWRHELQIDDAYGSRETIMTGFVTIHKASIKPASARAPLRVVGDDWAAG